MLLTLLFAGDWTYHADPIPAPAPGWGAFVEDVNGDGVPELGAVSHGTVPVWVEGRGDFAPVPHPFVEKETADRHSVVPCDIDGDGTAELVVGYGGGKGTQSNPSTVLWREGEGWRTERLPTGGLRGRGVTCVDLDNDNRPELFMAGHGSKTADQLLKRVDGEWQDVSEAWGLNRLGPTFGALFEDLDGDGDLDMVRIQDGQVGVLLQDGGTFTESEVPEIKPVRDIALGDVDNDGDVDVYLARGGYYQDTVGHDGARLVLKEGDRDAVSWQFPETCTQAYVRAQGDFKGKPARLRFADGREVPQSRVNFTARYADIPEGDGLLMWVDPDLKTLHLLAMGLEGRFFVTVTCHAGEGEPTLLTADVKPSRPLDRQDVLWLNDGTGTFSEAPLPDFSTLSTAHAQFVDVDLDGDLDVFAVTEAYVGRFENAPDLLLLNDGTGTFIDAALPQPERQPSVEGQFGVVIDEDGDGYPSLMSFNGAYPKNMGGHAQLWSNPGGTNGWVRVVALDGGTVSQNAVITVEADTVQTRRAHPAPDFRSNGTQTTLFGVGQAKRVKVTVVWPDGHRKVVRRVKPNADVVVER